MSVEVGGPSGEVGEHQQRQHDAEQRERAQIRAEYLYDFFVRPAQCRRVFAHGGHARKPLLVSNRRGAPTATSTTTHRFVCSLTTSPRSVKSVKRDGEHMQAPRPAE